MGHVKVHLYFQVSHSLKTSFFSLTTIKLLILIFIAFKEYGCLGAWVVISVLKVLEGALGGLLLS